MKPITGEELVGWLSENPNRYVYLSDDRQWYISDPPQEARRRIIPESVIDHLRVQGLLIDKWPHTKADGKVFRLQR